MTGEILEIDDPDAEEKQRDQEIIDELVRRRELEDLQTVMGSARGRALIYRLLAECGVYQASFRLDPYVTAWNEGKRQIGIWLFDRVLTASPREASMMQDEAVSRADRKGL